MNSPEVNLLPSPESTNTDTEKFPRPQWDRFKLFLKEHKVFLIFFVIFVAVVTVAASLLDGGITSPQRHYTQAYRLVNEKVSKGAAIIISLPKGVSEAEAKTGISFEPDIKGKWISTESENQLAFDPSDELEVSKYYTVSLTTPSLQISEDFLADEDPRIDAIFPAAGSEAHENSGITIIFNRPMVPLTTLEELEKGEVPVKISPDTKGKLKWISTRNLKFIPEDHLRRSTNYEVKVEEGFTSIDGLPVGGMTHKFTTRQLRYVSIQSGRVIYNQPARIVFNQPVDIEKTSKEIEIRNLKNGEEVPFIVEYGVLDIYNEETNKTEKFIDRSVINVYQKKDRNGRSGLWDFASDYQLLVKAAYPLEGDINLNTPQANIFNVPEIIESLSATSERSEQVEPNLFDPEGKLFVNFFEDVDLKKSQIRSKGLKNVEYGKACKLNEDGEVIWLGSGKCEEIESKKILILTFNSGDLGRGENVPIEFEKIYSLDGSKINAEPITKTITTYPSFQVFRTIPADNTEKASLTEFIICSNTPIKPRSEENYAQALITDSYLVFSRWQSSFRVTRPSSYEKCSVGQFETRIYYGLLPETGYNFTVKLEDDFGQTQQGSYAFTTTVSDQRFARFHNLQGIYNVTTPGKTKLTYAVENLEFVNLQICKVSPETFLEEITNRASPTDPPSISKCQSVKEDTIQLPKRYWVNNYFQVNLSDYFLDTLGHYIVTINNPDYRETYRDKLPIYERTYVSVTNLAVGEKKVKWEPWLSSYAYRERSESRNQKNNLTKAGQNIYWVNKSNTLEPVPGAQISIYTQNSRGAPIALAGTYITDTEGITRGEVTENIQGAVIKYLGDSAIISDWADDLQYAQAAQGAEKTYIYTDKPIYQPGQEVFIKGLDRIGYDGNYEIFQKKNANLKIFNSRGNTAYEQNIPVSEYGTLEASFVIPSDAPLGVYRIQIFNSEGRFEVQEYVPSVFKLDVESEKDEYIAGEIMKLTVAANYFFGVPVSGGEVSYSVTSQDYFFDKYKDEYFSFGGGWYFCYSCEYGDNYLFRGKATLGSDGKAHIEAPIDFNKFYQNAEEEGSKIFVINVTTQDSNGRSVSAQKSFIVHRGEVYIGIKSDKNFLPKNTEFTLRAKSVDINGNPTSKGDIELKISKIDWQIFKRQEVDGGFYYKSEKEEKLIKKTTLRTDREGNWSDTFSLEEEGQYEISLSTKDSFGNTITSNTSVYVYGEKQVSIRPTNNYTLEIETEKLDVNVGDRPEIIIKSPYKRAKALITVDRGKVFDYWVVDVNRNLYNYTIPIKEEYSPNIYVSVLLLSDNPEIKFGQVMFNIDRSRHSLNIDVQPDKTHYLPGETVKLLIKTRDYNNRPVPAEVSIAVADLSVLALKGNPKKNPLIFFYDGFPLTVTTASNIKNILYELDIPAGTKGGSGAGLETDLARQKRGDFRETAFWEGDVRTDEKGVAAVSFTLPDNLTTWQIESVGITKDTIVGVDYDEIIARKDLMVVPLRPRFVVPGDKFFVGAKIFNQTSNTLKIAVGIEDTTLQIIGSKQTEIVIGPGKTDTVYFEAEAPKSIQSGSHNFTLSAKSQLYEDVVENTIPITKNNTYESVATANFTKANSSKEYIYLPESVLLDRGGLTINANATMAVFLSDALNYLVSYPYGCSEQLASKLSSIGTVKKGLNIKNISDKFTLDEIAFEGETYSIDEVVKLGLGRIYENQLPGGGFAYYKGLEANFYLTLHVVQAMENLREAGFKVNGDSLNRAAKYLYNTINQDPELNKNKDLVILTAFSLMDVDSFSQNDKNLLSNRIASIINDEKFIQEDISSASLAYLAIITSEDYSEVMKKRVFELLTNRIDIDGRGAYLKSNQSNLIWQFYETPIKDTALLLKAITAHENEHPLLDKIFRWLLRSRNKDGAWGSTNNTLAVIDAMVDFLNWQKETESDFNLVVGLDEEKVFDFNFNADTILETFTHFVPIDKLGGGNAHTLSFERINNNNLQNNFYYDLSLKYYLPIDQIPPRDEGITISRAFYELSDEDDEVPLTEARVGDVIRGKITIATPKDYNFISIEDFIPAGFELVNFSLETEDRSLKQNKSGGVGLGKLPQGTSAKFLAAVRNSLPFIENIFSKTRDKTNDTQQLAQTVSNLRGVDIPYLDELVKSTAPLGPDFEEIHNDRLFLFKERLPSGVYEYDYYIRALTPGTFHHLPAVASEMYFPEIFGRTEGNYFTIAKD